jgi:hypothetical protein
MLKSITRRPFSIWLHNQIQQSTKAVALLVDKTEVTNRELECLSHLDHIEEFKSDLNLHKVMWVNLKEGKRCLLIQRTKPEKDDSKDLDSLGEIAAKNLIAKKIEQVDVIASSKIPVDV